MTSKIQKPTIMILGSEHLANPGMDTFNKRMDDVLAPKRQREIEALVQLLKRFTPTKIALEVDERFEADIQTAYQGYLKGTYQLKRGEGEQVGFRLAKKMGHSKLYCVDYWPESWEVLDDIDLDLMRYDEFAKAHNQEHLLPRPPMSEGEVTQDEDGRTWIESKKYETIVEIYKRLNDSEGNLEMQQGYLRKARIGLGTHYPGANWVAHSWYARNLKIFVNITRVTECAEDRILVIIGAGHVFLLQQFLEDSGDYIVESPLKYLDAEEA